MSLVIISGNNLEAPLYKLMGDLDNGVIKNINIDVMDLNISDKNIVDEFYQLIGKHSRVDIINSPYKYTSSNIIIDLIDSNIVELNYSNLSNVDKLKLDNYMNFLNNY